MNSTQVKNILTPIFGALATWLAASPKINFLGIDQATWNSMISAVGFGIVAALLGMFNKTTNLMDTVGNQPGTTVVTTRENAAALPDNADVIPATPAVVQAIKASQ